MASLLTKESTENNLDIYDENKKKGQDDVTCKMHILHFLIKIDSKVLSYLLFLLTVYALQ